MTNTAGVAHQRRPSRGEGTGGMRDFWKAFIFTAILKVVP